MSRIRRRCTTIAVGLAAVASFATAMTAPAVAAPGPVTATSICVSVKHPALAAQMSKGITAALKDRTESTVGLAVADAADGLTCALRSTWHFISASVIKATIVSALLLKAGSPSHLTSSQK
jgi:beta-lactamase class A